MIRNISLQLKAAFLLLVFYINLFVGLACAVGAPVCCNTRVTAAVIETKKIINHCSQNASHEKNTVPAKGCKKNCCNAHFIKFSQVDKEYPNGFTNLHTLFFIALISSFFDTDILPVSGPPKDTRFLVRGHHPPIDDIRISIQSLQI